MTNKPKNIDNSPHNKAAMAALGALIVGEHDGIKEFLTFLNLKDVDYWKQVKGVAFVRDIEDKDMWINIGKAKGLEDVNIFLKKCIKLHENRDKK